MNKVKSVVNKFMKQVGSPLFRRVVVRRKVLEMQSGRSMIPAIQVVQSDGEGKSSLKGLLCYTTQC